MESVSRSESTREVELISSHHNHRMRIEICAQWDRMSMQDVAAQMFAQCHEHYGDVGYLREPYYGEPYPTRAPMLQP